MPDCLILEIKDKTAYITLNRPDVYNAFNDELSYALQDALKEATRNDEVRVVVLTGAGKAFCRTASRPFLTLTQLTFYRKDGGKGEIWAETGYSAYGVPRPRRHHSGTTAIGDGIRHLPRVPCILQTNVFADKIVHVRSCHHPSFCSHATGREPRNGGCSRPAASHRLHRPDAE